MMLNNSRRHLTPVATLGFVSGGIGYLNDPDKAGVQHQVRVTDFRGSKCVATVMLTRHRHTIDGHDQRVWSCWNTNKKVIQFKNIHLKQITKSATD